MQYSDARHIAQVSRTEHRHLAWACAGSHAENAVATAEFPQFGQLLSCQLQGSRVQLNALPANGAPGRPVDPPLSFSGKAAYGFAVRVGDMAVEHGRVRW